MRTVVIIGRTLLNVAVFGLFAWFTAAAIRTWGWLPVLTVFGIAGSVAVVVSLATRSEATKIQKESHGFPHQTSTYATRFPSPSLDPRPLKRWWVEFGDDCDRRSWLVAAASREEATEIVEWFRGEHLVNPTIATQDRGPRNESIEKAMYERVGSEWLDGPPESKRVLWAERGKNIVICFDGTRNKPSPWNIGTNVQRTFDFLEETNGPNQVATYIPGVGTLPATSGNRFSRTFQLLGESVFGRGVKPRLADAYRFLLSQYQPGDRIYLFGFSRGAFTARAFAAMLDFGGVLRRDREGLIEHQIDYFWKNTAGWLRLLKPLDRNEYYRLGHRFMQSFGQYAEIEFMGLWDCVSTIGWRANYTKLPAMRHLNVRTARHAVSIDEWRWSYRPQHLPVTHNPREVLRDNPDSLKRIMAGNREELGVGVEYRARRRDFSNVWFAGEHSDIGGTFMDDYRLATIALMWMLNEASSEGLALRGTPSDVAIPGSTHRKVVALASIQNATDVNYMVRGGIHRSHWLFHASNLFRPPYQRRIPSDHHVHVSALLKMERSDYKPPNLTLPVVYVRDFDFWPTPKTDGTHDFARLDDNRFDVLMQELTDYLDVRHKMSWEDHRGVVDAALACFAEERVNARKERTEALTGSAQAETRYEALKVEGQVATTIAEFRRLGLGDPSPEPGLNYAGLDLKRIGDRVADLMERHQADVPEPRIPASDSKLDRP